MTEKEKIMKDYLLMQCLINESLSRLENEIKNINKKINDPLNTDTIKKSDVEIMEFAVKIFEPSESNENKKIYDLTYKFLKDIKIAIKIATSY